jgi:hypothetical protein
MIHRPNWLMGVALAAGLLLAWPAGAAPPVAQATGGAAAPDVGPSAHQILQEMSDYLATAEEMTFEADVSYDELTNDQMLQFGGVVRAALRRPDGLRVSFDGDARQLEIVFDGRAFTVHDPARNLYAVAERPGSIDDALDTLSERYGFSVPLADLLYSNPYETLVSSVDTGHVVGRRSIDGAPCHHLAFTQEAIDWQIWVEAGGRPVPRQLVITYKEEPGAPQYVARLSGWSFQPRLSKRLFEFDPPAGADAIELRPVAAQEVAP